MLTPRKPLALTLLASLFLSAGCLERKETITVQSDGGVNFLCTFDGEASEFTGHDALPAPGSVWKITDELTKDSNGADKLLRTATLSVAAGQPLPATYAANAADAEVSLRFPTTLTKEVRPDGIYYHFKRTIEHRDDARFTVARRTMESDSAKREMFEQPDRDMTPQEREEMVKTLRIVELDKQLAIVDAALATLKNTPQDATLKIRAAVAQASEAFDTTPTIQLLSLPKTDDRDRAIEQAANSYLKHLTTALDRAAAESLDKNTLVHFRGALATEQRRRQITENLQTNTWETRVLMPGELIASNADRMDEGHPVWEFHAPAIMDTDKVIMATSRVRK